MGVFTWLKRRRCDHDFEQVDLRHGVDVVEGFRRRTKDVGEECRKCGKVKNVKTIDKTTGAEYQYVSALPHRFGGKLVAKEESA